MYHKVVITLVVILFLPSCTLVQRLSDVNKMSVEVKTSSPITFIHSKDGLTFDITTHDYTGNKITIPSTNTPHSDHVKVNIIIKSFSEVDEKMKNNIVHYWSVNDIIDQYGFNQNTSGLKINDGIDIKDVKLEPPAIMSKIDATGMSVAVGIGSGIGYAISAASGAAYGAIIGGIGGSLIDYRYQKRHYVMIVDFIIEEKLSKTVSTTTKSIFKTSENTFTEKYYQTNVDKENHYSKMFVIVSGYGLSHEEAIKISQERLIKMVSKIFFNLDF